jgi:hypothetical protein
MPGTRKAPHERLDRLVDGIDALGGEVLRALSESRPPVRFLGEPISPLEQDLFELGAQLTAWHHRLRSRQDTLRAQARIQRGTRKAR